MSPQPHDFRSLKAKIRTICKQRRIRLEEFMRTFDLHRTKKIKVDQFKRALDASGLKLSAEEVQLIIEKYRLPEDISFVDYRRFCDLIDKVFTVKGLESHPELKDSIVHPSQLPIQKDFSLEPLSELEKTQLSVIKQKLLAAITTKGIVLKDVFHDFDRINAGKVTKPQFVRDIMDIVTISPAEVDILVKAYGNDLDVNYRALHYDLYPNAPGAPGVAPVSSLSMASRPLRHIVSNGFSGSCSNLADQIIVELEEKLHEITVRDRIRLKNFFVDYDHLRTGKCSEGQFKRSVKLCFTLVTEQEMDLLVKKYGVKSINDGPKVDYIRFCQTIEGKQQQSNEDQEQLQLTSQLKCSRDTRGSLNDLENEIYQQVMARFSSFVGTRRILIKPSFQDFDKGRREHVTQDQFVRVLIMLKMNFQQEKEKQIVLKRYSSGHGDKFVNYVTFCHDLEHWGDSTITSSIASEIITPSRVSEETSGQTTTTRSVSMLMRYLKQIVKRDRIRLEEFYKDYDKLRHGKITQAQFFSGLKSHASFVLTKEEMSLLANEFATEDEELLDAQGKRYVNYKNFIEEIESIFTKKGLERNPTQDLSTLDEHSTEQLELFSQTTASTSGKNKSKLSTLKTIENGDLTVEEEKQVTVFVRQLKGTMDRQRLDIKTQFEDFDRNKQGFISSTKFERVLSMFKLLPNEPVLARLVLLKFRETSNVSGIANTPGGALCDINYRAFLHALQVSSNPNVDILPDAIAFRQNVYAGGNTSLSEGLKRSLRLQNDGVNDLQNVLNNLRRQIATKRIRLKEFITEGDKLRLGEISIAKFHTALNRSGLVLEASEIQILSQEFKSSKNADRIDWRQFLTTLESSTTGGRDDEEEEEHDKPKQSEQIKGILYKLQVEVAQRRIHMKPYFQDYDHNKISRVTKFQFASVLDMMKLNLTPQEVQALSHHFATSHTNSTSSTSSSSSNNKQDVNYLAFVQAVDAEYQH